MSNPEPYVKGYSFSGYQATNPSDPLPGASVDSELANIATAVAGLVAAMLDVRRADGALPNGSVGPDQLSAALNLGFSPRGPWTVDTAYSTGDGVFHDGFFYTARVEHTSSVSTTPAGETTSTWLLQFNVDSAVGNMNVATYDPEFRQLPVYDADNHKSGTTNKVFTAEEKTKLAGIETNATASPYMPAGAILPYAGASAPTGWLFCYGQTVNRTTYAALFTALGETYGAGDGFTTFGLPDLRGRVIAGQDDMGGTSANRLTDQSGGVDGDTLGATGGDETHTLTTAQLASHTHDDTFAVASGGAHTHTVDGSNNPDTNGPYVALSASDGGNDAVTNSGGAHTHTLTGSVSSAGSNSPHNNVQPTIILNYIIKT